MYKFKGSTIDFEFIWLECQGRPGIHSLCTGAGGGQGAARLDPFATVRVYNMSRSQQVEFRSLPLSKLERWATPGGDGGESSTRPVIMMVAGGINI